MLAGRGGQGAVVGHWTRCGLMSWSCRAGEIGMQGEGIDWGTVVLVMGWVAAKILRRGIWGGDDADTGWGCEEADWLRLALRQGS